MIEKIEIENFKSIKNEVFKFSSLNILVGTNSAGKSSVIQAILFSSCQTNHNECLRGYCDELGSADQLLNVDSQKREFVISTIIDNQSYSLTFNRDSNSFIDSIVPTSFPLTFEENLYYLSANRIGQESLSKTHKNVKFGVQGEYLFGFYEKNQTNPIDANLYAQMEQLGKVEPLLNDCVTFWIERILELDLKLSAQRVGTQINSYYNDPHIGFDLNAFALGAGVSYLVKILVMGLSLKKRDVFIVENPEIHLHPKAIANLAEFFVILAKSGIQVILETHSEHILNKTRYLVYKNVVSHQDVCLFYRQQGEDFIQLCLDGNGRYTTIDGSPREFPHGFFDANLKELLEMV